MGVFTVLKSLSSRSAYPRISVSLIARSALDDLSRKANERRHLYNPQRAEAIRLSMEFLSEWKFSSSLWDASRLDIPTHIKCIFTWHWLHRLDLKLKSCPAMLDRLTPVQWFKPRIAPIATWGNCQLRFAPECTIINNKWNVFFSSRLAMPSSSISCLLTSEIISAPWPCKLL